MRRLAALLVGGITGTMLMSALAVLGVPTSASANDSSGEALPMGLCTTRANAVVAVDFAHWGGPIVRACGSTPTSGFDLLNEGGFHSVGTQHDGPGFICRISSSSFGGTAYPQASEPGEACVLTPPTTGYWSYWHANAGQNSWSYGDTGATEYSPDPGSVDLWVFGGTSPGGGSGSGVPDFSPNTVRATNTEPTVATTTRTTVRPSSPEQGKSTSSRTPRASFAPATGTHPTATHPTLGHSTVTHSTATHPTARTSPRTNSGTGSTTSVRDSAGADPTSSGGTPTVIDATAAAAKRGSSGSIWPVLVGVVVAALLAGGAGLTVLRRRSS